MPIINQNLDSSEKKKFESIQLGALATGVTQLLMTVEYDCLLQGCNVSAFGISGSPIHSLSLFRFAGGLTSIPLASTLAIQSIGTSGNIGFSLAAPGFSMLSGDVLLVTTGGANSSVTTSVVTAVVTALADIKVYQNTVV